VGAFSLASAVAAFYLEDNSSLGASPMAGSDPWSSLAVGVVLEAVGIPLIVVGMSRTSRWLPEGTLEGADPEALRRYKRQGPWAARGHRYSQSDDDSGPSWSLAPLTARDGPGMTFALTF